MNRFRYIEDLFIHVVDVITTYGYPMQYQDRAATHSFYTSINDGKDLTENQGKYILRILEKYKNTVKAHVEYENILEVPVWKKPFRVIDLSKRVWVEDNLGTPCIVFKFPYNFKETFDEEFKNKRLDFSGSWDNERKVRVFSLYDHNILQIQEFVTTYGFEIDESFIEAVSAVEDIWQNVEETIPYSSVENGEVIINAAPEDAQNYFNSKKTLDVQSDLLLAKNMGYLYKGTPQTMIEKISSTDSNTFWIKNLEEFIALGYATSGSVCILLDRTADQMEWMKELASTIDKVKANRNDWRVCFRASNKEDPEFNDWVSSNGFGGKISTAKFLIFKHKPHKWLFKPENDVTIVATNNLYPASFTLTRNLLLHHPCVLYVGNIEPSKGRTGNIVEL
jgi:hypothetical protein